ncbi:poly(3-hydroxyalkanoate) depolymerase [Exilibacterium tricleocarpae]|uniref:Poly(3-hydroxyalkanoate) depolymerase n=1 Tax=Exilibacterium tricleocarpae TaxID=2591008 RepID=A0A545U5E6_9GAMM|nr:poly(3-hydroxyalkanoate) depolymerase [Exilibacterium tricleocarpae]TQV84686.1 poly(3-hydroxyalkanoate) depolymerase [Exilibacterium tricleocarpae]
MRYFTLEIDAQQLRVGVKAGSGGQTPLLLFNGIGANLELLEPFTLSPEMADTEIITFDIPGTGGSPNPSKPYRFPGMAKMASRLLDQLSYGQVDVLGLSWGGALAQQYAKDHPDRCRRLVLAATSTGMIAVPPKLGVLLRMATPRRYLQTSYMQRIAPSIYGGRFRRDQKSITEHRKKVIAPSMMGYACQLFAGYGWTSLPWLRRIRQPTLIMSGDDDPLIPLANAKILHRLIRNSRLEIMPCGHLFMLTMAAQTAELVREFCAEQNHGVLRPSRAASGQTG